MYGIINKAIEDLVKEKFGENKWETIKELSGIDIDFFISNEVYDDSITFSLVSAISNETNIPVNKLLIAVGEWWILRVSYEKYGTLLESGGDSLRQFLVNLPQFHNRIMLIYPKLTPPEFRISDVLVDSIKIHYYSKREGLQEFVRGLLQGLGKLYKTPVQIELLNSRDNGDDHEIFKVSW
jgi:hypothetical protein